MSLIIPPGFAQVALRYSLTGDPEEMVTTYGIEVAGPGLTEAEAIADAHDVSFPGAFILEGWTFVGVTLRVGQDGGPPATQEVLRGTVGTAEAQGLPNNCAYLMSKHTTRGGRQGRGRMYWPPFAVEEGVIDNNGMIGEAERAILEGLMLDVLAATTNYLLHDESSPGSSTPDEIVSFTLQRQLATQRRRMRK